MAVTNKTATLTHKVRNPQNLDTWLDIWEAEVSADYNENNERSNEVVTITPSEKWKIPIDNLNLPVDRGINIVNNKIGHSNSTTGGTIGSSENTTGSSLNIPYITYDNQGHITATGTHTHNITITALEIQGNISAAKIQMENTAAEGQNPNNQNVIIRTNGSGYLIPGPIINSNNGLSTKFLNERGEWTENGYTLSSSSSNGVQIKLIKSDNNNSDAGTVQFTSGTGISITGRDANNEINIVANTNAKNQAGIVTASDTNNQKAWATDSNGNPTWRTGQISVPNKYITSTNQTFLRGFSNSQNDSSVILIENENDDYKIIFKEDNAITNSSLTTDIDNQHNISYEVIYEEEEEEE